jgi:hypothetical protein
MNTQFQLLAPLDLLASASSKLKGSKRSILTAYLILIAINICSLLIDKFTDNIILSIANNIIGNFLQLVLYTGISYIGIRKAFELPASYKNMFYALHLKTAIYILISWIFMFLPMFLFVALIVADHFLLALLVLLPILYLTIRISMTNKLVIHKGLNPFQAIHHSMLMTRKNVFRLVLCTLMSLALFIAGAIPFGIGLIWVYPLINIYNGEIYKNLLLNT